MIQVFAERSDTPRSKILQTSTYATLLEREQFFFGRPNDRALFIICFRNLRLSIDSVESNSIRSARLSERRILVEAIDNNHEKTCMTLPSTLFLRLKILSSRRSPVFRRAD